MHKYYEELGSVKIHLKGGDIAEYPHAMWETRGNFIFILQERIKTPIPIDIIRCIEVPPLKGDGARV